MQALEKVSKFDVEFVKGSDLANKEFIVHCGGACMKHFVFKPIDEGDNSDRNLKKKILNKWRLCVSNTKANLVLYEIIPFFSLIELTDIIEKGESLFWKLVKVEYYVEDDGTEETEERFLGYVKVHSEGFVAITTSDYAGYIAEELIRDHYWRLHVGF